MSSPARIRLLLPALLVAAAALLYGRTLTFDFVNYDDYDLVVRNTDFLKDPANVLRSFTTHAFSTHREEGVYYRPVLMVSYFIDYAVWGVNPLGYHLTNVLLHAGAVVLLYYLALAAVGAAAGWSFRGRNSSEWAAFFAALLFCVHPVQTESVAWVAGRNDVLLGLLLIGSMLCYVRQDGNPSRRAFFFWSSAGLFAAALLTKESAIFFAAVYPLYELTVNRETPSSLFTGEKHARVPVFLAIAAGYLVLRYNVFGAFIGAEDLYGKIPLYNRFLMAPGLGLVNLLFLVWPADLSIVHPIENVPWFEWPAIVAAVGVGLALIGTTVFLLRRDPLLAWSLGWLLVCLVPLLNVFPLAVPILEHRLYAGSAGFAMAAALGFGRLVGGGSGPRRQAPILAAGALAFLLASLTWARLPVWANSEALWLDAIAKEPNAARSYFNLAGHYFEQQKFDKVIPLLENYVALKPEDFVGHSKLRQSYFLAGRSADAARVCRTLIDQNPKNPSRYLEAGVLFERMGVGDSVVAVYEEGLRNAPGSFQIHRRLGEWHRSVGNPGKADFHLRAADSLARIAPSRSGENR